MYAIYKNNKIHKNTLYIKNKMMKMRDERKKKYQINFQKHHVCHTLPGTVALHLTTRHGMHIFF